MNNQNSAGAASKASLARIFFSQSLDCTSSPKAGWYGPATTLSASETEGCNPIRTTLIPARGQFLVASGGEGNSFI